MHGDRSLHLQKGRKLVTGAVHLDFHTGRAWQCCRLRSASPTAPVEVGVLPPPLRVSHGAGGSGGAIASLLFHGHLTSSEGGGVWLCAGDAGASGNAVLTQTEDTWWSRCHPCQQRCGQLCVCVSACCSFLGATAVTCPPVKQ